MKHILLFIIFFYFLSFTYSQNISIKGKIIDKTNNNPLQYVNVYIKGTTIGTVANINGEFQLKIPEKYINDTIICSNTGYVTNKQTVSNIEENSVIKLKPYIKKFEKVQIVAKKTNPIDILIKAKNRLSVNKLNSAYKTKVFSRNFVKKNNHFVSFRKTLTSTFPQNDRIWYYKGEVVADKNLSNDLWLKNINTDNIILYSLYSPPLSTDRKINKNLEKNKFRKKNTIVIDTVIFNENSKIYIIDVYEKKINKKVLIDLYKILDKNPLPYSLIYNKKIENIAKNIIEENFYFKRYYIDAKQNYNIVKTLDIGTLTSSHGFGVSQTNTFIYKINIYTNTPKASHIKQAFTFKEIIYNRENRNPIFLKSLFESFCYDANFNKDSIDFVSKPVCTQYDAEKRKTYDDWGNNELYIKPDSLEILAAKQIANPDISLNEDVEVFTKDTSNFNPNLRTKANVKITTTGIVTDSLSGNALEYCNVMFVNLLDSSKTGVMTNENGFYKIDLLLGRKYIRQFSFLGYEVFSDTIDLYVNEKTLKEMEASSDVFDIDNQNIKLRSNQNILNTVNVEASSRNLAIDKQSVIVSKNMRENTISAKDILNKIDGIKYNRIGQGVEVDNNKNVKILIDGVEKDEAYILDLNPKRIKKIEVLRNISGIYEIEGYESILNIITFSNYRGFDFKLSENYYNNFGLNKLPHSLYNQSRVSLNYTRDKLNFYFKTSGNYSKSEMKTNSETTFLQNDYKVINSSNGTVNNINLSKSINLLFGADYRINKKHLLGIEVNLDGFPAQDKNESFSFDTIISSQDTIAMKNTSLLLSEYFNINSSLFYKYNIDSTSKIFSYFTYMNKESQSLQTINNSDNLDYDKSYSNLKYNIEYMKRFKIKYTFTTGLGYVKNDYKSISKSDAQNIFINSFYKLRLYSYLKTKFNNSTGMLFGTSYEYYEAKNTETSAMFKGFNPRLNFYKKLNKTNKISVEYHLKTEYPFLSYLNNQTTYTSPFVINIGNPELKPFLYHNFSSQYQFSNDDNLLKYFSIKTYYSYSNNSLGFATTSNNNIITYKYENFVKHEKYGVESNISFAIKEKFILDFSFDIFKDWNKNISTPEVLDWIGGAEFTYELSAKQNFGLSYAKDSYKNITSLGYSKIGSDYLMLYWMTLQMNGRLQFIMGYSLPIIKPTLEENFEETLNYRSQTVTNTSLMNNLLFLSLTYNFSKGKVQRNYKNIDNENFEKTNDNENKVKF